MPSLNGLRDLVSAVVGPPPDDVTPCSSPSNSFREVVSLQALFMTLIVALLAYVRSAPTFQVRVDAVFAVLASLPIVGLWHIVHARVRTESGDVYVCTRPVRSYARHSLIMDVTIVAAVSALYWWGQLPGQ